MAVGIFPAHVQLEVLAHAVASKKHVERRLQLTAGRVNFIGYAFVIGINVCPSPQCRSIMENGVC